MKEKKQPGETNSALCRRLAYLGTLVNIEGISGKDILIIRLTASCDGEVLRRDIFKIKEMTWESMVEAVNTNEAASRMESVTTVKNKLFKLNISDSRSGGADSATEGCYSTIQGQQNEDTAAELGGADSATEGCYSTIQGDTAAFRCEHNCQNCSKWRKLSVEEKEKKKKLLDHRNLVMKHFEIHPYPSPPRNEEGGVSLDGDTEEEDQEVLDDLDHEEKQEEEQEEQLEGWEEAFKLAIEPPNLSGDGDTDGGGDAEEDRGGDGEASDEQEQVPYCIPCQGDICYCEDTRQVTYFPSDEESYQELEQYSLQGAANEDEQFWSSDDEGDGDDGQNQSGLSHYGGGNSGGDGEAANETQGSRRS